MRSLRESALRLVHLLLLAQLLVGGSSRPLQNFSLCAVLGPMIHHVDKLLNSSKKLHDLRHDDLLQFASINPKLESLPRIHHTAAHINSLKVNETLVLLYEYTESFRLHVSWLKNVKENFSLPLLSAEGAINHLSYLSHHLNSTLQQMGEEVPPSPSPPTLWTVPSAFDAVQLSVEVSEHLKVFCHWSKRILVFFRRRSGCHRH